MSVKRRKLKRRKRPVLSAYDNGSPMLANSLIRPADYFSHPFPVARFDFAVPEELRLVKRKPSHTIAASKRPRLDAGSRSSSPVLVGGRHGTAAATRPPAPHHVPAPAAPARVRGVHGAPVGIDLSAQPAGSAAGGAGARVRGTARQAACAVPPPRSPTPTRRPLAVVEVVDLQECPLCQTLVPAEELEAHVSAELAPAPEMFEVPDSLSEDDYGGFGTEVVVKTPKRTLTSGIDENGQPVFIDYAAMAFGRSKQKGASAAPDSVDKGTMSWDEFNNSKRKRKRKSGSGPPSEPQKWKNRRITAAWKRWAVQNRLHNEATGNTPKRKPKTPKSRKKKNASSTKKKTKKKAEEEPVSKAFVWDDAFTPSPVKGHTPTKTKGSQMRLTDMVTINIG